MANKKLQHILYPDFGSEVSRGTVPKYSVVNKFGSNAGVGTSYEPVTTTGTFWTPQTATTVRVKAGNVNDTADGTGARSVTVTGVDADGNRITETLATNGTSAGSNSTQSFLRIDRLWVATSGTYADDSTGSHVGDITVETSDGATDIATITASPLPSGQSQIGVYVVPAGQVGYLMAYDLSADATKTADFRLYKRESITDAAAPYQAMRLVTEKLGVSGVVHIEKRTPIASFTGPCDVGWFAKGGNGSAVSADMDLVMVTTAQGV